MPGIGPVIVGIGARPLETTVPQASQLRGVATRGTGAAELDGQIPSFTSYLKKAIDEVNALQIQADAAARAMLTGELSDIHQVTIATEKASLAMHLALEVRNKVLEAYQEIMRMQV